MAATPRKFTCCICFHYSAPSFRSVLRHIGSVHSWDPNLHITCGIQGCPRIYTSYRSYRKHITKKHPEFMEGAEGDNSLSGSNDLDVPDESEISPCHSPSPSGTGTLPSHSAALFILKAKEERRVSQRALDGLLEDFHEVCEIQRNALRDEVKKCLDGLKCTSVVIDAVDKVIERSCSASPFDGLHTAYLQQQYFQKHFHFVVSSILYAFSIDPGCLAHALTCITRSGSKACI